MPPSPSGSGSGSDRLEGLPRPDPDSDTDPGFLRVICGPDSGVFDGMNQAIAAAQGDWMLFLNAGDWLSAGVGKALLNAIRRIPALRRRAKSRSGGLPAGTY